MGAGDVIVNARLTVVPGKPSPSGKVHKLSYFDHLMQKHYCKAVFYFDTSSVEDRASIIPSLKESIFSGLSVYPVFAGRLHKNQDGQWEVKFNDSGVRVYEASCTLSMQEFFDSPHYGPIESELSRLEINDDSTITPVLVVQFTEFKCGNIAIGLCWHHGIGDPLCATLFMKAWGETHRGAQVLHPPFFHPPTFQPRPQSNLDVQSRAYYSSIFNKGGEDNGSCEEYQSLTLCFSHETVEQLISEVENGSCKFGPPTPSDVLSAMLWSAVSKAQGKSKGDEAKASLCMESRKIHFPPLPYGYVGNAIHFSRMSFPMEAIEGNDLSQVARVVNESVGMVDSEEVKSVADLMRDMENEGRVVIRDPPLFYSDGLTIAIFDHFFCYDVLFHFGKPVRVSYAVLPVKGDGHIIIVPAAEGQSSRNVMVTLRKDVMHRFLEDSELARFLPSMGGKDVL
ncbi:hypothetical protein KP509_15G062100 [Ceratopteris richardii]|nr:hypothetical protein KP509_15G062100 [Ceratopteris richardii]KAH7405238.1 hypothetical protein KP509_15G062100 [Ceratopteris richardii]